MNYDALEPVQRLKRDLAMAAKDLSLDEVGYIVNGYYALQEYRKVSANQYRALEKSKQPNDLIGWLVRQGEIIESQIHRALDQWTETSEICLWAKSITGIGPIISAGLAAHIDITKCPTVGHIWRFAGLDPTVTWEANQKRPWNADLKTLCWKIGESFVKVSTNENDVYGKFYVQRKELETARNDAGEFADQAKVALARKNYRKDTVAKQCYLAGKLPPAHIHARAKRWAVKIFLAHWHHVAYMIEYKKAPPKPYSLEHLGHVHMIEVPNWPQ